MLHPSQAAAQGYDPGRPHHPSCASPAPQPQLPSPCSTLSGALLASSSWTPPRDPHPCSGPAALALQQPHLQTVWLPCTAVLPLAARQWFPHPCLSCNFIFLIKMSVLYPADSSPGWEGERGSTARGAALHGVEELPLCRAEEGAAGAQRCPRAALGAAGGPQQREQMGPPWLSPDAAQHRMPRARCNTDVMRQESQAVRTPNSPAGTAAPGCLQREQPHRERRGGSKAPLSRRDWTDVGYEVQVSGSHLTSLSQHLWPRLQSSTEEQLGPSARSRAGPGRGPGKRCGQRCRSSYVRNVPAISPARCRPSRGWASPGNKFQRRGQGQPERSPVLFSGRQKGNAGSGAGSCPPPQPPKELCCFHLKAPTGGKSPSAGTARPLLAFLPLESGHCSASGSAAPRSPPPTAAGRALGLERSGALPGKQGRPELLPLSTALGRQLQRTGREQARKAAGKGRSGPPGRLRAWERGALVLTDNWGRDGGREGEETDGARAARTAPTGPPAPPAGRTLPRPDPRLAQPSH